MTRSIQQDRKNTRRWLVTAGALTLAMGLACGGTTEENNEDNSTTNNSTVNNQTTPTNNQTTPANNQTTPANNQTTPANNQTTPANNMSSSAWAVSAHPCAGNRTDALHCDDDSTCYVGCGTTTTGRGMFVTTDGGATWSSVTSTPAGFFDSGRVNDIWRSPDNDLLYVSGEFNAGFRVVSLDRAGTVGEVFKKGNTVDFSFTAGNYRRNAEGRQIAESLTGVGIVYKEMDGGDPQESWETGYGFWQDQYPNGVQILDMDVHDGKFYAAGSTISQPPMVFLPGWETEFDFDILALVDSGGLSAYSGEMWGIDVNDDGVTLGGVNQSAGRGVVYSYSFASDAPMNDRTSWTMVDLISLFPDNSTWIQGVCRGPSNLVYAVGRESREGWGIVLRSTDGGQTFEDISPYTDGASKSDLEDMYRCHVTSDGGVIVTGTGGQFAVWSGQ